MSCVDSISAEGEAQLVGDVTISAGSGIVLTQAGQDIEIALAAAGTFDSDTVGALTASSNGTLVSPDGSANTKGLWAELSASTPIAADGIMVTIQPGDTGIADFLVDIGVGAAASEVVVVSNILFTTGGGDSPPSRAFYPIPIAAGARIAARCQSSDTAAATVRVIVTLVQGGVAESLSRTTATTYGAVTADSGGTVVDPGAVINTKGAWAEISASVAGFDQVVMCVGNRNNSGAASQNYLLDIGIGAAASEVAILENLYFRYQVVEDVMPKGMWLPLSVAAGQRVSVRAQSTGNEATDRLIDVTLIGFSS